MIVGPGKWTIVPTPRPTAKTRLLCFHHGGGGAFGFRQMAGALDDHIELVAVQLPGRESRFSEVAIESPDLVLDKLVPALQMLNDRPYAVFGHSMGGSLAYLLSLRAQAGCELRPPRHVIASGSKPPAAWARDAAPSRRLSDSEIVEEITRLGGTPAALLDDRKLLNIFLPALRADFHLVRALRLPKGEHRILAPLLVLAGREDPSLTAEQAGLWAEVAGGGFTLELVSGGHFFPHTNLQAVVGLLNAVLKEV